LVDKGNFVDDIDARVTAVNVIANTFDKIKLGVVIGSMAPTENDDTRFSDSGNRLVVSHFVYRGVHSSHPAGVRLRAVPTSGMPDLQCAAAS
jgi:hypothetical protein